MAVRRPITAAGMGSMQEKVKARLSEIIERVNELFEGDLTDDDKLIYVNHVLVGKLLESKDLQQQAAANGKVRWGESPDLVDAVTQAVLDSGAAHQSMSQQALSDPKVMEGLVKVIVNFTDLYDQLRMRAGAAAPVDAAARD
jgi:type I restriction enzyme R subunit